MLQKLVIHNYAIIQEVAVEFSGQLNIITGETGAGKSILMGALSLILGDRADTNVLLNSEKKCCIEGFFDLTAKKEVQQYLTDNDLLGDDNDAYLLIIRREIAPSGKTRAFINDTPVNLQQLKNLAEQLVDLHQQFDTLAIGEAHFQRGVVDALAQNQPLLQAYQQAYKEWVAAEKKLQSLINEQSAFEKEFDFNQFLYDELAEAQFSDHELEDAEAELNLLSHSESIKQVLEQLQYTLKDGEQPLTATLKQLSQQLQHYTHVHTSIGLLTDRLTSVQIELQDIAYEASHIGDGIQYDPQKINQLNEKIALGYKLLKKHGVQTTRQLLDIQEALSQKLQAVLNIDAAIEGLQSSVQQLHQKAIALASKLTNTRTQQIAPLEKQVTALLKQVGMPNASIKVSINAIALHEYGADEIEILFDANNSNRFEPIRKVASGGELSRLMLCIKSLVAKYIDMPTLIFDEIDTGISGEAAKQVGLIMKQLAQARQIICITHQPQMASKADAHFFVYKQKTTHSVNTHIKQLQPNERVKAIAQMLDGEQPSESAMATAREMLSLS